jgi:hypothetical protein
MAVSGMFKHTLKLDIVDISAGIFGMDGQNHVHGTAQREGDLSLATRTAGFWTG